MKINNKNYYVSAFTSFVKFKETKSELVNRYSFFSQEGKIEAISDYLTDECFYPAISKGYANIGSAISRALSLISHDLGNRVKASFSDPISTTHLLAISKGLQRITTPLASCEPINCTVLKPLTQSIIGIARFSDVTLKDISTVLALPSKAFRLLSKQPYTALDSGDNTLSEKISDTVFFSVYYVFWGVFRIAELAIRVFQSIAHQIQFGRGFLDGFREQFDSSERVITNYLIGSVQKRETASRKELVARLAKVSTSRLLDIVITSTLRFAMSRGALYSAISALKVLSYAEVPFTPRAEKSIEWLADIFTIKTITGINLFFKYHSYAAFYREFFHTFSVQYNPEDHAIFYRKNLISGILNFKTLKSEIKKR